MPTSGSSRTSWMTTVVALPFSSWTLSRIEPFHLHWTFEPSAMVMASPHGSSSYMALRSEQML